MESNAYKSSLILIYGPPGSGKSTLAESLMPFLPKSPFPPLLIDPDIFERLPPTPSYPVELGFSSCTSFSPSVYMESRSRSLHLLSALLSSGCTPRSIIYTDTLLSRSSRRRFSSLARRTQTRYCEVLVTALEDIVVALNSKRKILGTEVPEDVVRREVAKANKNSKTTKTTQFCLEVEASKWKDSEVWLAVQNALEISPQEFQREALIEQGKTQQIEEQKNQAKMIDEIVRKLTGQAIKTVLASNYLSNNDKSELKKLITSSKKDLLKSASSPFESYENLKKKLFLSNILKDEVLLSQEDIINTYFDNFKNL